MLPNEPWSRSWLHEQGKQQKDSGTLENRRGTEEEGCTKARRQRNLRADCSRPDCDAHRGRQQDRRDDKVCGWREVLKGRCGGIESLRKSFGGVSRAGLVETDLRGGASGGTEPGNLSFHSKQRGKDTEHNAQRRESRVPDQEASLHIQQFTIRTFWAGNSPIRGLRIGIPWLEEIGPKRLCHCWARGEMRFVTSLTMDKQLRRRIAEPKHDPGSAGIVLEGIFSMRFGAGHSIEVDAFYPRRFS
jgi:hypothetical protein